jgi:hypothetical protein
MRWLLKGGPAAAPRGHVVPTVATGTHLLSAAQKVLEAKVYALEPNATVADMLDSLTVEACLPVIQAAELDATPIMFFNGDLDPTRRFDTVPPGTPAVLLKFAGQPHAQGIHAFIIKGKGEPASRVVTTWKAQEHFHHSTYDTMLTRQKISKQTADPGQSGFGGADFGTIVRDGRLDYDTGTAAYQFHLDQHDHRHLRPQLADYTVVGDLGSLLKGLDGSTDNDDDAAAIYFDDYLFAVFLTRLLDKGAAIPANLGGRSVADVWALIQEEIKRARDAGRAVHLMAVRQRVIIELGLENIVPCNHKQDSPERVEGAYGVYLVGALCCFAVDDQRDAARRAHPPVDDPTHAERAADAAAAARTQNPRVAAVAAREAAGGSRVRGAHLAAAEAFEAQMELNEAERKKIVKFNLGGRNPR